MKKHLQYYFSIAVAVFFSMNTFAQGIPDTLSTSFAGGADTYVANDEKIGPDDTGDRRYLVVRNHEVRMRIIYLKFDIWNNPRFDKANQAYIGMYCNYAEKMAEGFESLELSVYGMTDDDLDEEWDDSTLTYNTAPGLEEADLGDFLLDDSKTQYLTKMVVPSNFVGWVYSEPTTDMDEFINADENDLLTFMILVEEPNAGDEVRFDPKEDSDTLRPPILHGEEPIVNVESRSLSPVNMKQNFPNPFIGNTTLTYNLMEPEHVELIIYNMLGAKVATLVNEFQVSGEHNVNVDADRQQLSPGIYYATINVGPNRQTIKMINCK